MANIQMENIYLKSGLMKQISISNLFKTTFIKLKN